jgi:exopolysaccharide biosynthesis protein
MLRSILISFVAASSVAHAQSDTVSARTLGPGVEYRHVMERRDSLDMHVVRVDLHRANISLHAARATDSLRGRERPSEMVRRAEARGDHVVAAVNADFFWLSTGENENNQIIDGEWWKGLKTTDSPYDTWDNTHIQFAMDARGHPYIDQFMFDGRAIAHGAATPIITLNFNPSGKPEGTALYTWRFGRETPRDTSRVTAEAAMVPAGRRGDTLLYVRTGAVSTSSGSAIPAGGAVLAAYGRGLRYDEVTAMQAGDTVRVVLSTIPRLSNYPGAPTVLVGGWPRILRNGVDVTADAPVREGTISRNAETRHPRTAVGFSRDSSTLILLTVDGHAESEGGVTLGALAERMKALGAWEAMNFDGGGSTTMVIDGRVVNRPSDRTGERAVGNALMVIVR